MSPRLPRGHEEERAVGDAGQLADELEALLQRPGAMLSRAQLEDRLYGWGEAVESNAVPVYIHQLRRKLGRAFIRNVRGVGYSVGERARPAAEGTA